MNKQPLVSIIIPCYNHENFLDDCLSSILEQTYPNIEVLICDDCSPDNSYRKILTYKEKLENRFKNVVILKNETNCGVTKNINRMLEIAKGEFVKTIASDDCMSPDAVLEMVNFLLENPDVDVVVSNGLKVSEEQHYPYFSGDAIYPKSPDFSSDGFFERVANCNEISAPAAMVRMSVYKKYGLYDENVKVEDFEFWLRILKQNETKFAFLNKNLIYYRINQNSMSSMTANANLAKRRKLIHTSEMESLKKYSAFLKENTYFEIVLNRTLAEHGFAVVNRLLEYEKELRKEINCFFASNKIPPKTAVKYRTIFAKQIIRKFIRK